MGYFTWAQMKVCVKICPPRLISLVVELKVGFWLLLALMTRESDAIKKLTATGMTFNK